MGWLSALLVLGAAGSNVGTARAESIDGAVKPGIGVGSAASDGFVRTWKVGRSVGSGATVGSTRILSRVSVGRGVAVAAAASACACASHSDRVSQETIQTSPSAVTPTRATLSAVNNRSWRLRLVVMFVLLVLVALVLLAFVLLIVVVILVRLVCDGTGVTGGRCSRLLLSIRRLELSIGLL